MTLVVFLFLLFGSMVLGLVGAGRTYGRVMASLGVLFLCVFLADVFWSLAPSVGATAADEEAFGLALAATLAMIAGLCSFLGFGIGYGLRKLLAEPKPQRDA